MQQDSAGTDGTRQDTDADPGNTLWDDCPHLSFPVSKFAIASGGAALSLARGWQGVWAELPGA